MKSQTHRRSPQREQFWRETVAEWQKSGESVRAFCSRRGLQEGSFYGWRRTLRERDGQRSTTRRKSTLVPLRVVPEATLEVVLPMGLVVRVPAAVEASVVAKLVAALRTATC
jgi:transposase-like protein